MGDFNTGRNDLDIEGTDTRFYCGGLFLVPPGKPDLPTFGVHRIEIGKDWTWRSPKNGFRSRFREKGVH